VWSRVGVEDREVHVARREVVAGGEAGLAGADDDRLEALDAGRRVGQGDAREGHGRSGEEVGEPAVRVRRLHGENAPGAGATLERMGYLAQEPCRLPGVSAATPATPAPWSRAMQPVGWRVK